MSFSTTLPGTVEKLSPDLTPILASASCLGAALAAFVEPNNWVPVRPAHWKGLRLPSGGQAFESPTQALGLFR